MMLQSIQTEITKLEEQIAANREITSTMELFLDEYSEYNVPKPIEITGSLIEQTEQLQKEFAAINQEI